MLAFPDLPSCVTLVFRGRPTVGRGRHRLRRGWLVFMQVVHPGRRTLEAMARTHVPPTSDQRTRGPRDTIGTGRSTFWTYHTRLGWRPVGAVTVVLSKKGGTRHFATTLAPLPLRRTFLREGLRAFLGVPAEEQLIVDAHGERGSC